MSIEVSVNVDDPAGLIAGYGAGALLRLERASSEAGSYAEIATTLLVATTSNYTFWDGSGSSASWYRSRYTNSAATTSSEYSPPFRAGALSSYATLDSLREALPDSPPDATTNNYLADLLIRASDIITQRCDRDFFRHPQVSGTEVRTEHTDGSARFTYLPGIISLTTVEYASEFGGAFTALGAENTDWYLDDRMMATSGPYFSLRLPSNGSISRFYLGPRRVRLTGVFGFETVPPIIEAGTIALAREMYVLTPTGRGAASGGAGFGSIAVPDFLPRPTYEAINWGAHLGQFLYI